jgi:hypothetical protein
MDIAYCRSMLSERGVSLIGLIIGVVLVLLLLGFISFLVRRGGSDEEMATASPEAVPQVTPDPGITIEDITRDPQIFDGFVLAVEGDVTDWVTRRTFVIRESGGFLSTIGGILVIREEPFNLPRDSEDAELALGENVRVVVRGVVRIYNAPEDGIEDEVDDDVLALDFDLDPEDLERWDDQPVMYVSEVREI